MHLLDRSARSVLLSPFLDLITRCADVLMQAFLASRGVPCDLAAALRNIATGRQRQWLQDG